MKYVLRDLRFWHRSALFGHYLRSFILLWVIGKLGNAVTAAYVGLPPLDFRPVTEFVIFSAELLALWAFIKRSNEDVLLGNLGIGLPIMVPSFAVLHCALSAALALVA